MYCFLNSFQLQSPTYGIAVSTLPTMHKPVKSVAPITQQPQASREPKTTTLTVPSKLPTPSIAVTPSLSVTKEISPKKSPGTSKRIVQELPPSAARDGRRSSDVQSTRAITNADVKFTNNHTDVSECSTNTDEYATCTDTSKRTPGIKTPPTTTTSSSSTTQVPGLVAQSVYKNT
ncbi:integumentary mucin C.1-like [Rhagoletis pomonella]|uniref:integumentary mucin C.1-like n=1 Tax=Rhagoletis pomonella TaxID=28610 RepID=UPI00177D2392|nr:integumentary mucin C.1-like [Rhagoletis pomonella]